VLFTQFLDDDLGCASYLIGDEEAGVAVVVDPGLAIERYVDEAKRHDVRITQVLETHTHADHVSGHGRLALEHGAVVRVHPLAEPEHPFEPLADGDRIELGDVAVTVLHTPGHRPEHCCFAVADRSRADETWLVLTGDSLFVADTARPDLAVPAREGAQDLFHSLRRLVDLGDGVEVYPGHVAGSLCGAGMSSKASTTIGFERRFNAMLQLPAVEDFVNESSATSTARPPNVERIVALNRGPFLAAPPSPSPMDAAPATATLLDIRPAETFAAGHATSAINIPIDSSSFGTKAGFVLDPDRPVVLHGESEAEVLEAARRLNAVGLLDVSGFVAELPTDEHYDPVDVGELERLLAEQAVEVVDVRDGDERASGYIPGTRHLPLHLLRAQAGELVSNGPVVTVCDTGPRAGIAASVLAAHGVAARPVLRGGMSEWRRRGGETVELRRCG
jgi:glyoxylase-like metal-dependent hydrolase (beta-lactamase superfamily II)/rhodanese-related sulfurtransferase